MWHPPYLNHPMWNRNPHCGPNGALISMARQRASSPTKKEHGGHHGASITGEGFRKQPPSASTENKQGSNGPYPPTLQFPKNAQFPNAVGITSVGSPLASTWPFTPSNRGPLGVENGGESGGRGQGERGKSRWGWRAGEMALVTSFLAQNTPRTLVASSGYSRTLPVELYCT